MSASVGRARFSSWQSFKAIVRSRPVLAVLSVSATAAAPAPHLAARDNDPRYIDPAKQTKPNQTKSRVSFVFVSCVFFF
jgi:hypothetical protein